jgi:CheY-like chemotaxis protein
VNALTDEIDPTKEIRSLIEQLQQSARDARTQARAAEQQRDEVAAQLDSTLLQIEQFRANEREFRAQFVEISKLLRERDAAVEAAERNARSAAEATKRFEDASRERADAQRQRDDAIRQRDDAVRRRDEAARSGQEATGHVVDMQRQVISIRQARDAAQSVNLELKERLSRAEDEIADLGYARETAQKVALQASQELTSLKRQLEQITQDRDATAKQVDELTLKLDAQNRKVLDLTEQKSAVAQSDSEHSAALLEAREQMERLTAERDVERSKAQEHARELEALREQLQELRDIQQIDSVPASELAEAQRQLESVVAERDSYAARQNQAIEETASQQDRLAALADQLVAAQRGREEALTSLTAAQKQIEHIMRDRDAVRAQTTENSIVLEAQIAGLQGQITELTKALEASRHKDAEETHRQDSARELAERFERQRVDTIELATRLDAAQREILELTANLAEARLQVKFATARTGKPAPVKPVETTPHTVEINLDSYPPPLPTPQQEISSNVGINEPLTDRHAHSSLQVMRQCFTAYTKNSADLSLLNELHSHLHGLSERARVSGFVALHRLSGACSALCQQLYEIPEMVTPSTVRTIHQTIEFLTVLLKEKALAQLKDPAKAMIYIVDDDLENCRAIAMAMETVMVRTTYAQEPAVALGELASGRFDLIFLDVNLPGMDGFQLCAHIRELAIHTTTPIVFISGMTSMENRVQSSLSGGNEFVSKPFNLNELSVKALTLMLKDQLNIA